MDACRQCWCAWLKLQMFLFSVVHYFTCTLQDSVEDTCPKSSSIRKSTEASWNESLEDTWAQCKT